MKFYDAIIISVFVLLAIVSLQESLLEELESTLGNHMIIEHMFFFVIGALSVSVAEITLRTITVKERKRRLHKEEAEKDVVQLTNSGKFKLIDHETVLARIGGRTSWDYEQEIEILNTESPYTSWFKQGATISPTMFWFVDPVPHRVFGLDANEPRMQSSARSLLMAKKEYRGITMKGKVEETFIYASLLGSDIFPFCHLNPRIVVLPIDSSGSFFRMMKKDELQAKGYDNMLQWIKKAEDYRKEVRKEKTSTMNIYQRLDRSSGLTSQRPNPVYVVLYNSAGRANMVSCVLKVDKATNALVHGSHVKLHGFIAEHKCYFYYPRSIKEAHYLTSIINSDFAFSLLKKIKSARDIEKKIWELPIPEFNDENSNHSELSEIGRKCERAGKAVLDEEIKKISSLHSLQPGTVGILRKKIKKSLEDDIKRIDVLVADLIKKDPIRKLA